jgi:hypothetical protein
MNRLATRLLPIVAVVLTAGLIARSGGAAAQEPTPQFNITVPNNAEMILPGMKIDFSVLTPEPGKTYVWVFGDGTPPRSGPKVTHTFARVDDFSVRLTIQTGATQTPAGTRIVRIVPEMRGVFASDLEGQFTPADQFQMAVVVRAPGLKEINVRTASPVLGSRTQTFPITGGEDYLIFSDVKVADETDAVIREELVRKVGGSIPFNRGMFNLALDYTPPSVGRVTTMSFTPPVNDFFQPDKTIALTYPSISKFAGTPEDPTEVGGYYLKGNTDFSHTEDYYVRKLALEFGRRGAAWPDDPNQVSMNIYKSIDTLFDDGEPADFNNDYNLARLFEDGTLSRTRMNSKYICIAQTYFFTGLARTLGIPAREINNAIGEPSYQRNDGVWVVRWWQEAGLELWYEGAWHYYDTWLGFTDRKGYLNKNLIYQSWSNFSPQAVPFMTVRGEATGLKGHNFNAWPGDPPQWSFLEEGVRPGLVVDGMVSDLPVTSAGGTLELRTNHLRGVAQPEAAGILGPPATPANDAP